MRFLTLLRIFLGLVLLGGLPGSAAAQSPAPSIWSDLPASKITPTSASRPILPDSYRSLRADISALRAALVSAPPENAPAALELSLPLPGGGFQRFQVYHAPILQPELSAKYPEIQTYTALGLDDPLAYGRLDWTPAGFHAMILSPAGQFFIDPYQAGDLDHYISYYKSAYQPEKEPFDFQPPLTIRPAEMFAPGAAQAGAQFSSGPQLRTYRLALAATGEYTQRFGGKSGAISQMTTTLNRVNAIYERELSIRLVLVANNDQIVFTDPASDPYPSTVNSSMLNQNQAALDDIIGPANYDIGHVFSAVSGGGLAALGVVCFTDYKALGATSRTNPLGDAFDVDYVAHEIGHQFGASHTYDNCGGLNNQRQALSAFEPFSGSTIMAYAGICATDLQPNSDDYFHGASFDQITYYTSLTDPGWGGSCPSITNTGNRAPQVTLPPGGFTLPEQTPFTLTGAASDPDGDPLTINWEEFDADPNPSGPASPWFRSWLSVTSPARTFPRLSDLLNNTLAVGESLPDISSPLPRTFRLTARDNRGGVSSQSLSFTVTSAAGPFRVTTPNSALTWSANAKHKITWDTANTSADPVSCANVTLSFSRDGGLTYPDILAASTPNDGAQSVYFSNALASPTARVRAACASSIFFDISDVDFSLVRGANNAPVAPLLPDAVWLTRIANRTAIEPFSDADQDVLTYTATLSGNPLPAWLKINAASGTLSGTPPTHAAGSYSLVVYASDGYGGLTPATPFTLTVAVTQRFFLPQVQK